MWLGSLILLLSSFSNVQAIATTHIEITTTNYGIVQLVGEDFIREERDVVLYE